MEKYLIYKNENEIAEKKERAIKVESILKSVFEKLKGMGHMPNLDFLESTLQSYCSLMNDQQFELKSEELIIEYIKYLVIETSHPDAKINGVKISREKFADMIEINQDDVNVIMTYLRELEIQDLEMFSLTDFDKTTNSVILNQRYLEIIEEKYSAYAIGEKQIKLAKTLQKIATGLMEYDKITGREIKKECDRIEGLKYNSGKIELSASFIHRFS